MEYLKLPKFEIAETKPKRLTPDAFDKWVTENTARIKMAGVGRKRQILNREEPVNARFRL